MLSIHIMSPSKCFKDLLVWQYAHQFVLMVYEMTSAYPEFEKFGLRSQFTRAAVSIPANIAEGYKKLGKADKLRFMNTAQGSLEECRYYIILSKDLHYLGNEDIERLRLSLEKVSWYLNSYAQGIAKNKGIGE